MKLSVIRNFILPPLIALVFSNRLLGIIFSNAVVFMKIDPESGNPLVNGKIGL
jgi:hypothetical protein